MIVRRKNVWNIASLKSLLDIPVEHRVLEKSVGYSHQTLLRECMYAYITCCPDIRSSYYAFQILMCTVSISLSIIKRCCKILAKYDQLGVAIMPIIAA